MSQQANDNSESRFMGLMTRIADKTGALGSVVSAMGCAACFPALASFGAAIGLGFLSQYEGLFISRLLPLFAALAFLANALGWFSHRQWLRSLLGMIGPAIVFAATVLAARQLVDGEPDVRRPGLDDWGVDLGLRVAGASPLRTGRLRTPRQALVKDG
ncbi:mercuric transport protein [Klebsiella pneumoniae]|uniref:Mercuric transport protein n=20 Tax=Pseudomonadota TaxID=1224 RepID=A0A378H2J9_KLEPN|nr:mercuric transport protein [Klebsiella pneumoniae]